MLSLERQEAYRRRYAAAHPGWQPASHVYRDLVAARLRPGSRVLDLGCGRGGVLEELGTAAGLAVGLDPDLRSLFEHRAADVVSRTCGTADALPYRGESFDLVCCSWVLEHLPRPARVLSDVARVLVPGGDLVFVTPNSVHPLLLLNRVLGWTRGRLVKRLYGRVEADTFPAFYRANRPARLRSLASQACLELDLVPVGDPTYLAYSLYAHPNGVMWVRH